MVSSAAAVAAVAAASSNVNAIEQLNGQTIYLPTGYRFSPSDEQIVIHYLKNEIRNQPLPADIIPRTNVYSYSAPENIPLSTSKYGMENQWYFFTTRPKENPIITSDGCWKEIRDVEILDGDEVVGFMRTLLFHYEEPLNDETNTNWYIDEYSVNPDIFESDKLDDDAKEKVSNFVVCKICFGKNMSDKTCDADSNEGDTDSNEESDTDSDTNSDEEESDTDEEGDTDSDTVSNQESDTDSEKESNTDLDIVSDVEGNTDSDTDSNEEGNTDSDTVSDQENDTDSDTEEEESNTDIDSNKESDTDSDDEQEERWPTTKTKK